MISPFLKKLLFARQFSMIDGKIDILGKNQVLLPADTIFELGKINPNAAYKSIKNTMHKDMVDYARKLGSTDEGMLKVVSELFESLGLGSMEILDIDNKKRRCLIRVHNPTFLSNADDEGAVITPAILSGMFSFFFNRDVDAKKSILKLKGMNYYEYVIS